MAHPHPDPPGSRSALLICGGFLGLAVLAGGGTRRACRSAVLQLLALPLIVLAGARLSVRPMSRPPGRGLDAAGAGLEPRAMVPLPVSIWSAFGGRAELVAELRSAGVGIGWHALSLDPDATLRATLALLPPMAVGLLSLSLPRRQQVRLLQLILVLALASAVLGLAQLAGGPDSPLRWHAITNADSAVEAFANRNHLATLLVLSLPLARPRR